MDDEGLVYFDGGSYSLGPVTLTQPQDVGGVHTGRCRDDQPHEQQHHDEDDNALTGEVSAALNAFTAMHRAILLKLEQQEKCAQLGACWSPCCVHACCSMPTGLAHCQACRGVLQELSDHGDEEAKWEDDELQAFELGCDGNNQQAPRTTSELEHVLAWGGETRLRVKLLLSVASEHAPATPACAGVCVRCALLCCDALELCIKLGFKSAAWLGSGQLSRPAPARNQVLLCSHCSLARLCCVLSGEEELEVEVLRMTAARETWEGMLEEPLTSPEQVQVHMHQAAACGAASGATGPSLDPLRMGGQWKIFDLYAQPVFEEDVITGMHRGLVGSQQSLCKVVSQGPR